jgi:hypothetical protein
MLVDNANDVMQLWLHDREGEPALPEDQLVSDEGETEFEFRSGTPQDLKTFFIKTGGGSGPGGPLFLDDIYVENTYVVNLSNPTSGITAAGTPALRPAAALHGNAPNPFNPSTVIGYSVAEPAHVRLAVYDLGGRRVRTLVDEVEGAGERRAVWNGADDAGRPVASGVYFCRLEAGAVVETRRMVLVR